MQIALTTAQGEVQVNPTKFGGPNTKVDAKGITPQLLSLPFGLGWTDISSLKQILAGATDALALKIMDIATTPLKSANFGSIAVDIDGATDTEKQTQLFKSIYKGLDKGTKKYLLAGTDLYALGMPSNLNDFDPSGSVRWKGFDGFYENGVWNDESVKGIVTDGRGIGMIARTVEWNDKIPMDTQNIEIAALGITVQLNTWGDPNTRDVLGSLDIAFGAGVFDKSATKLITQSA